MNDKITALSSTTAIALAGYSWVEVNAFLSAVASVISIVISLITLVGFCLKWWKKSTEDGKITIEEIQEGIDGVKGGLEEIADKIEKEKEDE